MERLLEWRSWLRSGWEILSMIHADWRLYSFLCCLMKEFTNIISFVHIVLQRHLIILWWSMNIFNIILYFVLASSRLVTSCHVTSRHVMSHAPPVDRRLLLLWFLSEVPQSAHMLTLLKARWFESFIQTTFNGGETRRPGADHRDCLHWHCVASSCVVCSAWFRTCLGKKIACRQLRNKTI